VITYVYSLQLKTQPMTYPTTYLQKKSKQKAYENHLHEMEPRWFAVYTKYKNEKFAIKLLQERGVLAYVPLQEKIRVYTRKKKRVQLPLFPGYIFVKIIRDEYIKVLETEGVVKFVHFSRNLIAIPEYEIDLIRRILGEKIDIAVEQGVWNIGDAVEIIAGNLTGLKGRLIEQKGKQNFLVALERFGYSLRMNIDKKVLRKLEAVVS